MFRADCGGIKKHLLTTQHIQVCSSGYAQANTQTSIWAFLVKQHRGHSRALFNLLSLTYLLNALLLPFILKDFFFLFQRFVLQLHSQGDLRENNHSDINSLLDTYFRANLPARAL